MIDVLRCSKVFSIKNTNSNGDFGHCNRFKVIVERKKEWSDLLWRDINSLSRLFSARVARPSLSQAGILMFSVPGLPLSTTPPLISCVSLVSF